MSGGYEKETQKTKKPEEFTTEGGFTRVPVRRGITEIQPLLDIIAPIGGFICGGYARYCASPVRKPFPASDVDVFCTDEEVFKRIKSRLKNLTIKFENVVSISYCIPHSGSLSVCPKIQLIKPMTQGRLVSEGSVEDILNNFDFTVIRAAIIGQNPTSVVVDKEFDKDEAQAFLRIKNIHCPISSTLRFCKYYKKGYKTSMGQILKLFADWENRDVIYKAKLVEGLDKMYGEGMSGEERAELYRMMIID